MNKNAEIAAAGTQAPSPLRPLVGVLMELDPNTVVVSELSFRPPLSPTDPSDQELRASMRETGGNMIAGEAMRYVDPARPGLELYQVFSGHRALEVCRELGVKFQAMVVDSLPDLEIAMRMVHSNLGRKAMPGVASGRFYEECMKRKLFKSQAEMAERFACSPAIISMSCSLARLPPLVISAFGHEDAIQHRFQKKLRDALLADEKAVLAAARRLTKEQAKRVDKIGAPEVMAELTKTMTKEPQPAKLGATEVSPVDIEQVDPSTGALELLVASEAEAENSAATNPDSLGLQMPVLPSIAEDEADEVPGSSSRPLRREAGGLTASASVQPLKGWSILVDGVVDAGLVVRTAADEVQGTLFAGHGLNGDDCRDLADLIARFIGDRGFKPDLDAES